MSAETGQLSAKGDDSAHSLDRMVRRYNEAWSELAALRSEMFPPNSLVNVDCGQYVGTGRVVSDCGCPIDKLPVQVGNGNVWWYPLIACSPNKQYATDNTIAKKGGAK